MLPLRGGASFERRRTDLPERRMAPSLVIEHLNVIEQLHFGVAATLEALGELDLQRREERLHDGVVVTVTPPTHTAGDAVRIEHPLIVLARIGAPPIRVMKEADRWTSPLQRHIE